jgi:glycerol-3-phosphate dehydrogenase (NAD(P)+)
VRENPFLKGVIIPDGVKITALPDEAAHGIAIAVFATPSFAVAETAELFKEKLPKNCIIVCISKGIEKDTTRLFSRILREAFGEEAKIASLSGPTHAEEVGRQIPTACVVASEDIIVAEKVQDVFMSDYMRVYTSPMSSAWSSARRLKTSSRLAPASATVSASETTPSPCS